MGVGGSQWGASGGLPEGKWKGAERMAAIGVIFVCVALCVIGIWIWRGRSVVLGECRKWTPSYFAAISLVTQTALQQLAKTAVVWEKSAISIDLAASIDLTASSELDTILSPFGFAPPFIVPGTAGEC